MPGSGQALSSLQEGIKKVAQGHGRSQQGGYFSNILNILLLAHYACVQEAVSAPKRGRKGRLAMGWGRWRIILFTVPGSLPLC